MSTSYVERFYNTATLPPVGMDFPQPKNFMVHTASRLYQSGSVHYRKRISKQATHRPNQRHSITLMHIRLQTLKSDPTLHYKTSSQNIGTYMVRLLPFGPYRRYHIKTQSGRVLLHNRRFLRRRSPASRAPPTFTQQLLLASQPATHSPSQDIVTQPCHAVQNVPTDHQHV